MSAAGHMVAAPLPILGTPSKATLVALIRHKCSTKQVTSYQYLPFNRLLVSLTLVNDTNINNIFVTFNDVRAVSVIDV